MLFGPGPGSAVGAPELFRSLAATIRGEDEKENERK